MTDLERDEATERSAADSPRPVDGSDSGAIGERVSAILRAAEEAADQIGAEARRKADSVLRQARTDAE
jgi:cell division septum initiation protein DivIVA